MSDYEDNREIHSYRKVHAHAVLCVIVPYIIYIQTFCVY